MDLVTEYPSWYILICLALGGGLSYLLYRKDTRLTEFSKRLVWLLAILRFVLISLLAVFLLSPLMKTVFREVEKPIIIIGQDNSRSLLIGKDSSYHKGEYRQLLETLIDELGEKYEVRSYEFGASLKDRISYRFDERQTDVSAFFQEIHNRFSNRNVGALVMASDGIFNKGSNPVYSRNRVNYPIYTVALGDTSVRKDLVIRKVVHNRLAYLGNKFPMEIAINAKRLAGHNARLTIRKRGKTVFEEVIEITEDAFTKTIPVLLEAQETGIQRYAVQITKFEDEVSYVNNRQDIYIDVLDGRQRLLLLARAPHPDISAIRFAVESNENYEIEVGLAAEWSAALDPYDLVVLHQLPFEGKDGAAIVQRVVSQGVPILWVLGSASDLSAFNGMEAGLRITGSRGRENDSQGILDKDFALFTLSEEARNYIGKFPPLQSPFGTYKESSTARVLLRQRIGIVETDQPLIVFNSVDGKKSGVIAGEGIWRWRLNDFGEHGNHNIFNEMIIKMVQYLALKVDKSHFRVASRNDLLENENILFDAEVYNDSYELVNEMEVTLEIENEEGQRFPFVFSKKRNAYSLDAGNFPIGEYKYKATTRQGEKVLTEVGEFSVRGTQVEAVNTIADHQLLYDLAFRNGGKMLYPDQLADLPGILEARGDVKPVSYTQKNLKDLINLKGIFFLLLSVVSLEWFLRKRNGAY